MNNMPKVIYAWPKDDKWRVVAFRSVECTKYIHGVEVLKALKDARDLLAAASMWARQPQKCPDICMRIDDEAIKRFDDLLIEYKV